MKLRRIGLIDLFATIIGSVLLFVTKSFVGDPGVGWHLKTGQWIAEQRAVPQVDPFLFTTVDKPWVANQWLSDLLWWNVYAFGGWALIHVTFAGLVLSVYVFGLYPLLKRYSENTFVLFLVVLAASFVGSIQWIFRPVIFTLLFLTFTLRLSYAWWECSEESFPRVAKRTLLIFPILFLIWVNFHPGFPIGGVIFGLAVVGTIFRTDCSASEKQKRAFFGIATGVLMLIATLVNPYGYRVHENILALLGNNYFMNLNLEWFAADLYGLSFLPFFVVLFIAFYLYGRGRERVFHLFDVAIFALFLYLSLQQRRFIPFFGIVSSVFLVKLFSTVSEPTSLPTITRAFREISRKDRYSSQGGYFLFLWVLCMTGTIAMGTVPFRSMMFGPKRDFPTEAISAIAELEEPARIFHTPDWGGVFHTAVMAQAESVY